MLDFLSTLFQLLAPLWEMSVIAAYAAAVVIVLRLLLKKQAPRQVLCLLWLVVFARLLIPASLESPLSIVPNALPGQEYLGSQAPDRPGAGDPVIPAAPRDPVQNQPQNQPGNGTGIPVIGNPNPSLSVPEGVSPAAPAAEAPDAFPWQAVIAGVWLAGAAAMGGYALVSWLRLRRRLFDAIRAGDGAWEHPAVDSPFILGVLRPRIYLPAGLTGQPRQFILCHERAHLRRLDHIVKPVCWIALTLHWFNPLVWAAFLLMSRDIESACDEAVVRRLGSEIKADYSNTLLSLATGWRIPAPCPLAFDEGDAGDRIRNVLNYRRPALWAIVISVAAAALAAVCLLTDPVAAKAEGGPDPDPGAAASQTPDDLADTPLDPWMREILDGERTFSGTYNDRAYSINDLFSFLYGDIQEFNFPVMPGKLAIIDLNRDGINELVIHPVNYPGGMDSIVYNVGYLILHRVGDEVYGYNPPYRGFYQLKSDGTFWWSNSAFNNGTGSARFTENGFEVKYVAWCDYDSESGARFFVDGRKAAREEFEAAVSAQDAKPEPIWYVYEDGVLSPCLEDLYTFHVQVSGGRNLTVVLDTPQPQEDYFAVNQIRVYEGDKLLQTIETKSVPQPDDYDWDGLFMNRGSWVGEPDIRDLNFDGSQDFGLLAVSSYPHNVPYSYFLWNTAEERFDYGFTLFGSDCLKTDAEKGQLIEYSHDVLGEYTTVYTYAADGTLQKR